MPHSDEKKVNHKVKVMHFRIDKKVAQWIEDEATRLRRSQNFIVNDILASAKGGERYVKSTDVSN